MSEMFSRTVEWQQAYLAAVLEVEDARLLDRIENAEEAITLWLQNVDGSLDAEQAQALCDAAHSLHVLRSERLRRDGGMS